MEKMELLNLAEAAISKTLELANSLLSFRLPEECRHGIYLPTMVGGPLLSLEAAIDCFLTPEGRFPPIVDLAVRGCTENASIVVWLRNGDPDVLNMDETWNDGFGPFKPMGLMTPFDLSGGGTLNKERMEALGRSWSQIAEGD